MVDIVWTVKTIYIDPRETLLGNHMHGQPYFHVYYIIDFNITSKLFDIIQLIIHRLLMLHNYIYYYYTPKETEKNLQ